MNIKEIKGYDEFKSHCNFALCTKFYSEWTGIEKYIIITDASENYLLEMFPEIMSALSPYVIIGKYFNKLNDDMRYNDLKHAVSTELSVDEIEDNQNLSECLAATDFSDEVCSSLLLDEALEKISPDQKSRIIRRYYQGMSFVEIAKQDKTSPQAVRASIERALASARKNILG